MIRASKGLLEPKKAARIVQDGIAKRKKSGERFKIIGVIAVGVTLAFLIALFSSILAKGIPGFFQYYITLEVKVDRKKLDPDNNLSIQSLYNGDARGVIRKAVYDAVGATNRSKKRIAGKIVSNGAEDRLRKAIIDNPNILNTTQSMTFAVDDDVDSFLRGFISRDTPESERRINNQMIAYIEDLKIQGRISYRLSDYLIFGSASRNAEMAGIKGAFIGSLFTLSICFMIAFPLGISTAIYLEEIAPKNRITELIEININNLAAVPSVVFGILGLAVFISIFGMPRSIPLIGGVVLALMTIPTIIISSRAAIRAVPPSIRDAALAVGASKVQTIFHHVVPLAMPGMLTGTIIGMAQALGETAPLLMIGMVAFIVDVPGSVSDPGTVLPVQIFMWADFAERMFVQKTSAAIIVLIAFLVIMNASAVWIRNKIERRW